MKEKCDFCGTDEDLWEDVDGHKGVLCYNCAYELQHNPTTKMKSKDVKNLTHNKNEHRTTKNRR